MAETANSIPAPSGQALLTAADLNTTINHEPRVADLRLAEALGFADRHKIRPLIERHREALERFGQVSATRRKPTSKGGRPGTDYWLNRKQALYITAKSDTPTAADITIQMVEVFDEYLKGQLDSLASEAPGQYRVHVGGQDLLVDASAYEIREGQQAVVCGHDGKISVLPGPLRPSSMTVELGKRSVVGPMRLTKASELRQEWRGSMYIVLGRVVSAAASIAEHPKPVRVRQHRRALPKPATALRAKGLLPFPERAGGSG